MMHCIKRILWVTWIAAIFASGAYAAESDEQAAMTPGFYLKADLYGKYNPNGILLTTEFTYNVPYRYKHNMVWSHFELGYHLSGTVVHSTYGVHCEWMPAAFFRLRANYDIRWYHGTMGSLAEFSSTDVPHDESDMMDYSDNRMGMGHRFWLAPTLQFYFKGIALVNQTDLKWYLVDSAEPYFFNWEYNNISERKDFLLASASLLMYNFLKKRFPRTLFIGGMYEVVYQPSTDFRSQSLAAVVLTEPLKEPCRIGMLHFLLGAGAYLEETYRSHEPFVILNVGTTYDFRTVKGRQ